MATIRRLINDYGQIINFNHQLARFFVDNEPFLKKHEGRKYSDKTLLGSLPDQITVRFGLKHQKKIALSEAGIILSGVEIHCIAEDNDMFFGFSMKLLLKNVKNGNNFIDFVIAYMKPTYNYHKTKSVKLNHRKKMISSPNDRVIIFSSQADFKKVLDFCQQTIQTFNEQLPKNSKLVVNVNF